MNQPLKIVQSTWVRYHHFDLARELHRAKSLERIFTSLPWWKADKESREQMIPRDRISCNFLLHGIRRMAGKLPLHGKAIDERLSVIETQLYSRWVARNLPACDVFIGISGSGLHAGRLAKARGGAYIMDRGSTQVRHADEVLRIEHERWGLPWRPVHPWLIENEEAEAQEADMITVPSRYVWQTFVDQGADPAKVRVVPYGVSLEEFKPAGHPPDDSFRLVFVGQFSLRKGAPYLLQAFKDFRHPRKELIVVGAVAADIRQLLARIGIENVHFAGVVPRAKVKEYLSTSHALVLPSVEEGLALVQGQAMACACPVIATPNTGSETLFTNRKEGLIVPARDCQALVDAFELLASDSALREAMRTACLARVRLLGGWSAYGNQMLEVAARAHDLAAGRNPQLAFASPVRSVGLG